MSFVDDAMKQRVIVAPLGDTSLQKCQRMTAMITSLNTKMVALKLLYQMDQGIGFQWLTSLS